MQVTAPSFYSMISNDEDTLKIVVQVMNGMSASATELQKYLSYWDKYKYIWENDKVCHRVDDKLYHATHMRPPYQLQRSTVFRIWSNARLRVGVDNDK